MCAFRLLSTLYHENGNIHQHQELRIADETTPDGQRIDWALEIGELQPNSRFHFLPVGARTLFVLDVSLRGVSKPSWDSIINLSINQ